MDMKTKRTPKLMAGPKAPHTLQIPAAEFPDKDQVIKKMTRIQEALISQLENAGGALRYAIPENVLKGMAAIATNAWKARSKMLDAESGEPRDEMKRVYRHVEAILETFQEMGIEIKDHTNQAFDYGLQLKVVTTQPTAGITKERVLETVKPTIRWQNQIIQMGEVVIETPA